MYKTVWRITKPEGVQFWHEVFPEEYQFNLESFRQTSFVKYREQVLIDENTLHINYFWADAAEFNLYIEMVSSAPHDQYVTYNWANNIELVLIFEDFVEVDTDTLPLL